MKDTIFYVGGGKGGVGKSMISIALVQFLIDRYGESKAIHLIETDESNPDVGRIYKDHIPVSTAILDENQKGWIMMGNIIEKSSNAIFIINSAARSNIGIRKNGAIFAAMLGSGKVPYNLVTLWPMNRQKDSVMLLEDFLEHIPLGKVYPIRNNYFGEPDEFTLYTKYHGASSLLRSRVKDTLNFPALADVIADDFYTGGRTIPETIDSLSAFAGQSLLSWRNQVYAMFESTGEFTASGNYQQAGDE